MDANPGMCHGRGLAAFILHSARLNKCFSCDDAAACINVWTISVSILCTRKERHGEGEMPCLRLYSWWQNWDTSPFRMTSNLALLTVRATIQHGGLVCILVLKAPVWELSIVFGHANDIEERHKGFVTGYHQVDDGRTSYSLLTFQFEMILAQKA